MSATSSANAVFVGKVFEYLACQYAGAPGWEAEQAQQLPAITRGLEQGCAPSGPLCKRAAQALLPGAPPDTKSPLSAVGLAVLFADVELLARLCSGAAAFADASGGDGAATRTVCARDAEDVFNAALRAPPSPLPPKTELFKLQSDSRARSRVREAILDQLRRAGQTASALEPEPAGAAAAGAPPAGGAEGEETGLESLLRLAGAVPAVPHEVMYLLCPKSGSGVPAVDPNVAHADGRLALLEAIKALEHDAGAVATVKMLVDGPMAKTLLDENRSRPFAFARVDAPATSGAGGAGWAGHALLLALERAADPGGAEVLRFLLSRGAAARWDDDAFKAAIERATALLKEGRGSVASQYWLEVGRAYRPYNPTPQQLALWADADLGRLQAMPYSLVGQSGAKITVGTKLLNWVSAIQYKDKRPLCMFLAGPPGHGQDELVEVLADMLQLSDDPKQAMRDMRPEAGAHIVAMGAINAPNDFTTLGAAYGSKPTAMEDWLDKHDGKRGLLVFDKMDKLRGDVTSILGAMLPLLEEGVFTITAIEADGMLKRKFVDTRKLVILFTSNWGQDPVLAWFEQRVAAAKAAGKELDEAFAFFTAEHAQWLQHSLGDAVREDVRHLLAPLGRDALLSRVDAWVPFVPFSRKERNVVVETLLQDLAVVLAKNRDFKGASGPVERMQHRIVLTWDFEVVEALAAHYKPLDGVRSMRAAVSQCNEPLAALFALLYPTDERRAEQARLLLPGDRVRLTMRALADPTGLSGETYKGIGAVLVTSSGEPLVQAATAPPGGGGADSSAAAAAPAGAAAPPPATPHSEGGVLELRQRLEALAVGNGLLQRVPGESVAYAIEFSGGMGSNGAYSRATALLREALDIQMQLHTATGKTQLVGVVCFASRAEYVVSGHLQEATLEHVQALSSRLPHSPDGGTSVQEGILAAARMVPTPQQIFVLTGSRDSISAASIRAQGYAGEVHLRYAETGHNQGDVAGMREEIAKLGGTVCTCSMYP